MKRREFGEVIAIKLVNEGETISETSVQWSRDEKRPCSLTETGSGGAAARKAAWPESGKIGIDSKGAYW